MTATATGIRGNANLVPIKYDIANVINLRDRNRFPLLSLLTIPSAKDSRGQSKSIKKRVTTDPKFYWFEDTFGLERFTGASTVDATGGTLTLASGGNSLQAGDVLLVAAQKWVFEVSSITSDTAVVVLAEKGGATATASAVGDVLLIGNANEEGARARNIKSTTMTEPYGYCQLFRTPIGITNTAKNTDTWVKENDLDYQRMKKHTEHLREIEKSFLFGKLALSTGGTHSKRFTDGVINKITTNATANVDTEAEFLTFLSSQVFAHGNSEKYLFCSSPFLNLIEGWFKNRIQIRQDEKTFGIKVMTYESSYGTLHLIRHELLTGTTYGNYGVALDMENLTYRFLQNRDTQLLPNRQANDEDSVVEEYLSEVGLQVEQETTHAVASVSSL